MKNMQIINGRWVVDDNLTPIDERTSPAFVEFGKKIKSIYGKNITYSRIELVNKIDKLSEREENSLNYLLNNADVNKLAGY